MKRAYFIGLVATTLSTSCFSSVHTLAAPLSDDQHIQANPGGEVQQSLSNSIRMLGTQTPLIQAYGLVILQQPDIKVAAMSNLAAHQTFAKTNVREWLDEYSPQILNMNQEILRFNTRFNSYYNNISHLLENPKMREQDKQYVIDAINQLQQQSEETKKRLEQTEFSLNQFEVQTVTDSNKLSEKVRTAIQSLEGESGNIQQLRKDIKQLQEEIQNNLTTILNRPDEISKGSINIAKELFKISSTTTLNTFDFSAISSLSEGFTNASDSNTRQAALNFQKKQKELVAAIQKLAETQSQATEITCIEDQVNSFADLISRQVRTFKNAMIDWRMFEEKLIQLKSTVQADTDFNQTNIQKQLTQLKDWNDTMYKQAKQFEDAILQISVR